MPPIEQGPAVKGSRKWIAHLYLLRVLNEVPAYLVFVYFVNDNVVNGPQSVDEWTIKKNNTDIYALDRWFDL